MGDTYPKFKAAAIQAAPVFLNREATVEKACNLIQEAAKEGAELIAFPEVFIPAYPYWNFLDRPFQGREYFRELVKNAVEIPSPSTERLCEAARRANAYVVMGINEKVPETLGTLYNTNFIIDRKGKILGAHRKLVPTFFEKLTWGFGDGHSLRVYDTDCGKLGMLNCGENGNSLARFALIAQGEQVHVGNYPGQPVPKSETRYDIRQAIQIRSAAHAFEGKLFNVVACSVFSKEIAAVLGNTEEKRLMVEGGSSGLTAIFGPNGDYIAGPLDPDEEGMVIAEIDIEKIIDEKMIHDLTGHFNRFDVVSLNLNRRPLKAIREVLAGQDQGGVEKEERQQLRSLMEEIAENIGSLASSMQGRERDS